MRNNEIRQSLTENTNSKSEIMNKGFNQFKKLASSQKFKTIIKDNSQLNFMTEPNL